MNVEVIEKSIKKIDKKLKTLSKEKIKKLEATATLNPEDLNTILSKNAVNSITSSNAEFEQYLYNKFKRYNSLRLSERIVLMSLVPMMLKL